MGPVVALAALIVVGAGAAAMRVSRFYAAGRAAPALYAGLAIAALAAATAAPFAPPAATAGAMEALSGVVVGALLTLASGRAARASGATTLPDFVGARFPAAPTHLAAVALATLAGGAAALAGLGVAASAVGPALGVGPAAALWICAATLAAMLVPGGLGGALWGATVAGGLALATYALIAANVARRAGVVALWRADGPVADGAALIAAWSAAAPPSLVVALGLGLGAAASPALLAPFFGAPGAAAARGAAVAAWAWGAALAFAAFVAMAATAASLGALSGERIDRMPGWAAQASARQAIAICGAPGGVEEATRACASRPGSRSLLQPGDVTATGGFLLTGYGQAAGGGGAMTGLAAAALTAVSLALAAMGLFAAAGALGHDAMGRLRKTPALTSRRLATTRLVALVCLLAATLALARWRIDPATMAVMSLALAGGGLAPLIGLAHLPRVGAGDAAAGLLVGAFAALATLAATRELSTTEQAGLAALAAAVATFATATAASYAHAPREADATAARRLRAGEPIVATDRGA
ncbi:MAG: hypothetical protein IPL88_16440 [Rhizobiales bacterium]|nr:hypothetical protein [Hyphomicrobiales bacterium]